MNVADPTTELSLESLPDTPVAEDLRLLLPDVPVSQSDVRPNASSDVLSQLTTSGIAADDLIAGTAGEDVLPPESRLGLGADGASFPGDFNRAKTSADGSPTHAAVGLTATDSRLLSLHNAANSASAGTESVTSNTDGESLSKPSLIALQNSLLSKDGESKYSQTNRPSVDASPGFSTRETLLNTNENTFDALMLKQGRATSAVDNLDRMLTMSARQDAPANSFNAASFTAATPISTGSVATPLPLNVAPPSAGVVEQFSLYHSPAEPEFADEFTARVQMMAKDGLREARLQLHPAELGRLQVSVVTEGDQARVSFVADTPAARDLIEQNLPRLREMLEQQGLQLAQTDVGQRGGDSFADQDAGTGLSGASDPSAEADSDPVPHAAVLAYAASASRIDIHV